VAAERELGSGVVTILHRAASDLYGVAWELRRRWYAAGLTTPARVGARVVSIGNLTAGGTGKTTLAIELATRWRAAGADPAVICRRYRPGPGGRGDEELMFEGRLGKNTVFAGRSKLQLAAAAAAAGHREVLVDDGFSHWPLERDLDIVLIDARDHFGGDALLPAGRLREPHRALQRADVVVVSRLDRDEDPEPHIDGLRPFAPAAEFAAGRHRVVGVRSLSGDESSPDPRGQRYRLVTATGSPAAVERSAREAGLELSGMSAYRDHHWFSAAEIERERREAASAGAALLLTAKDAVRWPAAAAAGVQVLEVEWQWLLGGDRVMARVRGLA
jgi:tetraacyldisaccharide 4'-kinase